MEVAASLLLGEQQVVRKKMFSRLLPGSLHKHIFREQIGSFLLSHLNNLQKTCKEPSSKPMGGPGEQDSSPISPEPPSHLVDVLAEGGHGGELADEVQVSCTEGEERAAVVRCQVILVDLGNLLQQRHSPMRQGRIRSQRGLHPPCGTTCPAGFGSWVHPISEADKATGVSPQRVGPTPARWEKLRAAEALASPSLRDPNSKTISLQEAPACRIPARSPHGAEPKQLLPTYLHCQHQADEVHDDLLVSQLDADEHQHAVESLVVSLHVALLLAYQVDVPVELLAVLRGHGEMQSPPEHPL